MIHSKGRALVWIVASVAVLTGTMAGAQARAPRSNVGTGEERRLRIIANVSYNLASRSMSETITFTQFLEQGTSNRSYEIGNGVAFDFGAIYSITAAIGIMGSFEIFNGTQDGNVDVSSPHPLFFDQNRVASDQLSGLDYKEQALHIDFVYSFDTDKITVDLFGGPSFFFTETELIDEGRFESAYPFDDITLVSTTTTNVKDNPIGFNAGAAVTYWFSEILGAAFQARYTQAGVSLDRAGGAALEFDAGGFRVGGGIRLLF